MKNLEELKNRAIESGFKYAYGRFEEEVTPPHLIVTSPESDNFSADDKVFLKVNSLILELTTIKKDLEIENKIEENILYDVVWSKEETNIDDENVYNVSYFFEI
uniref:Uncharacterized protein n=1 Tax=Myoviridae sp. ctXho31 TaxID=2825122 RepID=A0A8S5TWU9_9CAUD|nr:MAG TPA: hypothetical protein [Myoviridae sp. ctXho31]